MGSEALILTVSMDNDTESGTERHTDLSTALTQMVPNNPSTVTITESPLFCTFSYDFIRAFRDFRPQRVPLYGVRQSRVLV